MSKQKEIAELDKKIQKKLQEVSDLRRKQRELKAEQRKIGKIYKPMGRPRLKAELIKEAELLAYDHPLPNVALKLGISLQTLYNYGISRKALNTKIVLVQKE